MREELTSRVVDAALSDAFDRLPIWVLDLLDETVVRVLERPLSDSPDADHVMTFYRRELLRGVHDLTDLERNARAELLRVVCERFSLGTGQALSLASVCF